MLFAILNTIVLGLGIALNPVAMMASLLIVREAPAGRNGGVFVAGWITGLAVLAALSSVLALNQLALLRSNSSRPLALLWLGLGVLLLLAGAWSLRRVARQGRAESPRRWLKLVEGQGPARTFGVGLLLAAFSLRNLALLAAAGSILSQADLPPLQFVIALAVFVALSSLGTLGPFLVRTIGGEQADATLSAWGAWLVRNMEVITAVFMLAVGGYLGGRGVLLLA